MQSQGPAPGNREDVVRAMAGLKMLSKTRSKTVLHDEGNEKSTSKRAGHDQVEVVLKSKLLSDESSEADADADAVHQFELMPEGYANSGHAADPAGRPRAQREAVATRRQDPTVETVLAGMQDHTVRTTKKISCARRGINPNVAMLVSHRIRHFRNHVQEINLSNNPLRMEGLLHLMHAIHDAHHIHRIDIDSCELDFDRVTSTLQNPEADLELPEIEPMSGDEDGASGNGEEQAASASTASLQDSARETPEGQQEETISRMKLIDHEGKTRFFAPISSNNVYTWSASSSSVGGSEEEEDNTMGEADQAALRFKQFLQDQKQLGHLNFSHNILGLGGAWMLSQAAQNAPDQGMSNTLRILNLSDCLLGIKDASTSVQQLMICCKVLTRLDISNNSIRGIDACNILQGLAECPSLEEFSAAHNAFGEEEAAQALGRVLANEASNLKSLDLRFNRFAGSRLSAWPPEFASYHSHVLKILDSLLPMLARFDKGHDPVRILGIPQSAKCINDQLLRANELDQYRDVYVELSLMLDEQLAIMRKQMSSGKDCAHGLPEKDCSECGTFTGSITHLLASLSSLGSKGKLQSFLLSGNLISDEITGTILHLASKTKAEAILKIEHMRFSAVANGDMLCIVRLARQQPAPTSTHSANSYHVLSVEPRELVLDCGMHMLELQQETSLAVRHTLETGLKMDRVDTKPTAFMSLVPSTGTGAFMPSGQLTFEKEIQARLMSRTTAGPRNMPQLSARLQHWKGSIGGARAHGEQALATAMVELNDEMKQAKSKWASTPASRVRHIGKAPGTLTPESVSRMNTPQRAKTPPTPSYKSLWSPASQQNRTPSPISLVQFERSATPSSDKLAKTSAKNERQKQGASKKKNKGEWKVAKMKFKLGLAKATISEDDGVAIYADPEGNDAMYKAHASLPTFACVERFDVTTGPADYFILHPVSDDGSYPLRPRFFAGKGAPSIDQKLSSLHTRGDLINLASASAATGKIDTFWNTISVIRQCSPSIKDSWVAVSFNSPQRHVIGEPFCFDYCYTGADDRLPDSYRVSSLCVKLDVEGQNLTTISMQMDWIGLYKVMDEKAFWVARDTSERVGCSMILAKFRPPHAHKAQIQLRHFVWEPGIYQLHMNLVNSEKVIGSSAAIQVSFARCQLSCPAQVAKTGEDFELKFLLDYHELVHPPTDWIGIFPKNPPSYTPQSAIQRLLVGPKNYGVMRVNPAELFECEICYFQDFGNCQRILGRTSVKCVQRTSMPDSATTTSVKKDGKAGMRAKKRQAEASDTRHLRFYVSGTFEDMQKERAIMHGEVMSKLRHLCDVKRLSVSFIDVRHGFSQGGAKDITDRINPDSDDTFLDSCLTELDKCAPYFICLLGQVYGDVPKKLPSFAEQLYPWFSEIRWQNKAVVTGCHMSLTEMECLNAAIIDDAPCKHARFFLRDQNYTASKDASFKDGEDWKKHAMNLLCTKIKRAVEVSKTIDPQKCMVLRTYHNPQSFAKLLIGEVMDICEKEALNSNVPDDNSLFWTQLDAESAHVLRAQAGHDIRKLPSYLQNTMDVVKLVNRQMYDDVEQSQRIVITGSAGSGKSAAMALWVYCKVQSHLFEEFDSKKAIKKLAAATKVIAAHKGFTKSGKGFMTGLLTRQDASQNLDQSITSTDVPIQVQECSSHHLSFRWYKSPSGKRVVVVHLHGRAHHRIPLGFDLTRALVMSLYVGFDRLVSDEQLMDDRLADTLNQRLLDFPPEQWVLYFVLDGLDRLGSQPIEAWLPRTRQQNVHWLVATSDGKQTAALQTSHYGFRETPVPEMSAEQRRELVEAVLSRNGTPHNADIIAALQRSPLASHPEFLSCAVDALRSCTKLGQCATMVDALVACEGIEAFYEVILRKWVSSLEGAQLFMSLLCLSETGLYEYELMHLLECPTKLGPHAFIAVRNALQEVIYSCCGVRKVFNTKMSATFKKKILDKESRQQALRKMECYFGTLPSCKRKLDEYAFVLEKLNDWNAMYHYVTDINTFHQMYSDPVRKLQFLSYMQALKRTPEAVRHSLRQNFEKHFLLSKRWFSSECYYYELNPQIYKSQRHLFNFQDIVYTVSSFFELHGKHEDCIRDLESSLKAMFGISDLYQIPKCRPESCLYPLRVVKILKRLCHIYSMHLEALVEHWLAPNEIGLPKRQIPDSMRGLDVSWWATPLPTGVARTLPQKLKLIFAINQALSSHYLRDENLHMAVCEICDYQDTFGHLADLTWNSGLECFTAAEDESGLTGAYGKTVRDAASLRSLPLRINYPRALSPGHEARRRSLTSSGTPQAGSDAKDAFLGEKKGVHKETSLTWSQKSDRSARLPTIEPTNLRRST